MSTIEKLQWSFNLPAAAWDRHLAEMRGHPLQSALWGDARQALDGIADNRWAVFLHGLPVLMARFEIRPISLLGRVAWMPRGPTVVSQRIATVAYGEFLDRLRRAGYLLCIDDAYHGVCEAPMPGVSLLSRPQTVWINLREVREKLWGALDSQWRYGVRSAGRAGVAVEQSRDPTDVSKFFGLCEQISKQKKFALPGSKSLIAALCAARPSVDVEARLFVARLAGELAAGAIVLRCGPTLHYFWGAVDRRFAKQRAGEAVQWGVIEWGIENGLETYDLEGIDPKTNPGTYKFKMKMGGKKVSLPGKRAYPLGIAGRIVFKAGQWLGRI